MILKYCSACGLRLKTTEVILEAEENFCHPCWQEDHPGQAIPTPTRTPKPMPKPAGVSRRDRSKRMENESGQRRPTGPNWNVLLPLAAVAAGLVLAGILLKFSDTGRSSDRGEPLASKQRRTLNEKPVWMNDLQRRCKCEEEGALAEISSSVK